MADHRFEVVVRIFDARHLEPTFDEQGGKALVHGSKVVRKDVHNALGWNHHAVNVFQVDDRLGQSLAFLAMDVDAVRNPVELLSDAVDVAKGEHLPPMQQNDLLRDALDFTENVAADEHGSPHPAKFPHDVHDRGSGKELGDVLWYIAAIGRDIGYSLEVIAEMNIEKLSDRKERGKIKGEGDNR